jgi:hypothetical protein
MTDQEVNEVDLWLCSLPTYTCPICGQDTIFETQCLDCEESYVIR